MENVIDQLKFHFSLTTRWENLYLYIVWLVQMKVFLFLKGN